MLLAMGACSVRPASCQLLFRGNMTHELFRGPPILESATLLPSVEPMPLHGHKQTATMMRPLLLHVPLILLLRLVSSEEAECNADGSATAPYRGVDFSYPIHSDTVIPADENPLGDKQSWYDELIGGCRKSCERCDSACVQTESDRIVMNRRQPQSMVNYTDFGIKKIKAPEALMKLLTQFWETNQGLEYPEGKYLWRIAYCS